MTHIFRVFKIELPNLLKVSLVCLGMGICSHAQADCPDFDFWPYFCENKNGEQWDLFISIRNKAPRITYRIKEFRNIFNSTPDEDLISIEHLFFVQESVGKGAICTNHEDGVGFPTNRFRQLPHSYSPEIVSRWYYLSQDKKDVWVAAVNSEGNLVEDYHCQTSRADQNNPIPLNKSIQVPSY